MRRLMWVAGIAVSLAMMAGVALAAVVVAPSVVTTGTIQGTVRDTTGTPIPNVYITLTDKNSTPRSAKTDANGLYQFTSVPTANGPFRVSYAGIWAPRIYANHTYDTSNADTIVLTSGSVVTADLTLEQGCYVTGTAHRHGHPEVLLPAAQVTLTWGSEPVNKVLTYGMGALGSGSDGAFISGVLAPGTWGVTVTPPSAAYGNASVSGADVDLAQGETRDLDLAFPLLPVTTCDAKSDWYGPGGLISMDVTDGDLAPFATTYSVDGVAHAYSAPFLPSGEGTMTLAWASADASGNIEATHSAQVRIDRTAPQTTSDADGDAHPLLELAAADALSGVASTSYRIDGGAVKSYTGPVPLRGGYHTIDYWSTDAVGNVEDKQSGSVLNPTATLAGTVRVAGSNASLPGINVEVYEAPSTPGATPNLVRTVGPTAGNGSYEATGVIAGDYLVRFVDPANHYTPRWSNGVAMASNASTLTLAENVKTTVNATMSAAASISGRVMRRGTSNSVAGAPVALDLHEAGKIEHLTGSTAGNGTFSFANLSAGEYSLSIDGAPAECLSAQIPTAGVMTLGSGEDRQFAVDLDPIGPVSIHVNVHRLGGGQEPLGQATVTGFELSGTGVMVQGLTDEDGNVAFDSMTPGSWRLTAECPGFGSILLPGPDALASQIVSATTTWNVDAALPLLPSTSANVDGRWYKGSAHVTLTPTPGDLPIDHTEYTIRATTTVYDAQTGFDIDQEGVTHVDFASVDTSGNVEEQPSVDVHVDGSSPVSTSTVTGGPAAAAKLSAADAYSGVAQIRYRLDAGASTAYAGPIVTSTPGTHLLEFWAVDNVGNEEAHHTIPVVNTQSVVVGKLSSAASVKRNKKFSVTGLIWPKQSSGNKTTKILAYREVKKNKWVLARTFSTTSKPSGSKSKFTGTLALAVKGRWKLVAHSPGYAGYWQADSPPRYVVVK